MNDIPSFSILAEWTGAGLPAVTTSLRWWAYILIIHRCAVIQTVSACVHALLYCSDGKKTKILSVRNYSTIKIF